MLILYSKMTHLTNFGHNKNFSKKSKTIFTHSLTYFQPVFPLRINQVVGFYRQNVWKTAAEEWHVK